MASGAARLKGVLHHTPQSDGGPHGARKIALYLCAVAAIVLASPGYKLPYLFDDYEFLQRAQSFGIKLLAPEAGVLFYRPLSRDVYFWMLGAASGGSGLLGHVLNSIALAATVILGGGISARLSGPRAGVIAGLLIATFAYWPVLVGWVCGSQDLFAVALTLAALHLQLKGRGTVALVAFAGGVLAKETAVTAAPALVAAAWMESRSRPKAMAAAVRIGILVLVWAAIHPGVHVLIASGGGTQRGGYIGFHNPGGLTALGRSVPALLNLPLTGYPTSWPKELNSILLAAFVPFLMVLWALRGKAGEPPRSQSPRLPVSSLEVAGFSLLFALPPILLTCLIVRDWAPYYLCFPAVGLSIWLSRRIAAIPYAAGVVLLSLYVTFGVASRGVELPSGIATERGLAPAGKALPTLEKNFKRVMPSLPPSALVYVSTMAAGPQSVYIHMHWFQVLRVWYADPTVQTLRPELRVGTSRPEFLFWIDPSLNVFRIDVQDLSVRSSGEAADPRDYRSTLTSYAVGLASLGDTDRAVTILLGLSDQRTWNHMIDRRVAATLLMSQGEDSAAVELVRGTPKLPYELAIQSVGMLLTVPTRNTHLEEYALRAFEVPPNDLGARRVLLRGLLSLGHYAIAGRVAQQILALKAGDRAAAEALETVRAAGGPMHRPTQLVEP